MWLKKEKYASINGCIIDNNSHLLKHTCKNKHTHVCIDGFKMRNSNYKSSIKRKTRKALYIKVLKTTLKC